MKFSWKLVICNIIIIAIFFSVGGYFMVNQNFKAAFDSSVSGNRNQHSLEKYAVESKLMNTVVNAQPVTQDIIRESGAQITNYLGEQSKSICVFDENGSPVFNSLPEDVGDEFVSEVLANKGSYLIRENNKHTYMLIASLMESGKYSVTLLSAYDITGVFTERDRQLLTYIALDIIIIIISVLIIFLVSKLLTKPIEKLNAVSKQIADGAYGELTGIKSSDEIGQLSRSFDQMSEAIQTNINKLNDEIERKDRFVSNFSHEMKTPMTTIIGYADLIRSKDCPPDLRQKSADYIYRESKRLEELSLKLMDLLKLTEKPILKKPFSTINLQKDIENSLLPQFTDVKLELSFEESLILADRSLLISLIRNLAENAKKSDPKDKAVYLCGRINDETYRFEVKDNGCGIGESDLKHIAEPFYMADKSRSHAQGGNGLGLAICELIAKAHNTKLEFNSTEGRGTIVSFSLEVHHEA